MASPVPVVASPVPQPQYLIEKIMPVEEVHLISGPSGSGNTTLMLQLLDDWRSSRECFGFASHPAPFYLVSCDRPATHIEGIMQRMNLSPDLIPHFSLVDSPRRDPMDDYTIDIIAKQILRSDSRIRVLFIDGLSVLCPGKIIDHTDVGKFLRAASRVCLQHHLTILGTVYASKSRSGEGYTNPRDRMLGSGAWSAFTGCKIIIEPHERVTQQQLPPSTIHVLSHNVPALSFEMEQSPDTGMFSPATLNMYSPLDQWIITKEEGDIVTTAEIKAVAAQLEISSRTAERWIASQKSLGTLIQVCRGEYRVSKNTTKN